MLERVDSARVAAVVCILLSGACGRFGFSETQPAVDGPPPDERLAEDANSIHLQATDGWVIETLVDLSAAYTYNPQDFFQANGTVVRDNAPSYVAALASPFTGEFAVIAGRSVIEVNVDNTTITHDYRPAVPDAAGPDAPAQITVADIGDGPALWLTASSDGDGDGVYRIDRKDGTWPMQRVSTANNVYPLAFDPAGSFDGTGIAKIYDGSNTSGKTFVDARTATTDSSLGGIFPPSSDDFAVIRDAMYFTVETPATETSNAAMVLRRLQPGPSGIPGQLGDPATSIVLAEGSTENGLFALRNGMELDTVDPNSGVFTRIAWNADPAHWEWIAVSAPRTGHRLADDLIVLESNRTINVDRLLRISRH